MSCIVNVAADLSGVKVNLALRFSCRPHVDDLVRSAEVAFTNYAHYALGLSADRAHFSTLAVVVFDPSAISWELIDEADYPLTTLAPDTQVYLFQPQTTEIPGEIQDPVDAQLFLAPLASSTLRDPSAAPLSRSSQPHREAHPWVRTPGAISPRAASQPHQRISRGTSTVPLVDEDTPNTGHVFQPPRRASVAVQTSHTERHEAVAGPYRDRGSVSVDVPRSSRRAKPSPAVRPLSHADLLCSQSPHWTPTETPIVSHARHVASPSYSRPASSFSASVRSPAHTSHCSRQSEVPRSWLSTASASGRHRRSSPLAPVSRSPLPENRGKSILREERERLAHLDEVSLDHLRADLKREEQNFEVSLESRSVSQQSHH